METAARAAEYAQANGLPHPQHQPPPTTAPVFPPPSQFDRMMGVARGDAGTHAQAAEIQRICRLPIVPRMTQEQLEEFNRTHVIAQAYTAGFRLFDLQAEALRAFEMCNGGFFPLGVGWGKTLTSLGVANIGWSRGIRKMVYFCPASVYVQLVETDIRVTRARIPITYPIIEMGGGKGQQGRRARSESGKNGLYLLPYSLLSTQDGEKLLASIAPGLIILDECHNVRHRHTARTKRLMRYINDARPEVVDLSGTITSKSIMDYHHLITAALGTQSPLPLSPTMAEEWAAVLDADAISEESSATGPLMPLIEWAQTHFPDQRIQPTVAGFRAAYRLRLSTCPGVVSSGDADIGIALHVHNLPVENAAAYQNWTPLTDLMDQVSDQMMTPNGDIIEHRMLCWKWLFELTAGFYNSLSWPSVEELATRKHLAHGAAEELLSKSYLHHLAKQEYSKVLRKWLADYHRPGCDTPMLVGQEMDRNGAANVGSELFDAWTYVRQLDFQGRIERDKTPVRVCDYKVMSAAIWANEHRRGVIWCYHEEMLRWVVDYLRHYGIPHVAGYAGRNAEVSDTGNKDKIVVASIGSHREGKNLQHHQNQLVVEWPRSASWAEQMLGRLHRNGQEVEELFVHTNHTTEWDRMNFAACINDSLYIHQTTGSRQKLVCASYHPAPEIFPDAVLEEWGLEPSKLTPQQRLMLENKFRTT